MTDQTPNDTPNDGNWPLPKWSQTQGAAVGQPEQTPERSSSFDTTEGPTWVADPPPPPPAPAASQPEAQQEATASASGAPGAWWAAAAAPTPKPVAPPAPPQPSAAPRRARPVVIGALVGALVGSLVSAGLLLAFRDDTSDKSSSETTDAVLAKTGSSLPRLVGGNDTGSSVRAILARVGPAVVRINIETAQGAGGGTGFIVSSDGAIVTNSHVAENASKINVTLSTGDVVPARVLGTDQARDLAVIKIDRTGLPTATLGDSDALQVGDAVVAIGNALDLEGQLSVTTGIVSATDRIVNEENGNDLVGAIQTDAAINPGNSGGPLVNSAGEVVGINTAIANPADSNNVGFAIAISSARPIIDDLRDGKVATVAFLGVDGTDVTPSLVKSKGLKVTSGSYVEATEPGSPAVALGIRKGDVVVQLDSTVVHSSGELRRAIRRRHAGDKVTVIINRDGKRITLHATLGTLPSQ